MMRVSFVVIHISVAYIEYIVANIIIIIFKKEFFSYKKGKVGKFSTF